MKCRICGSETIPYDTAHGMLCDPSVMYTKPNDLKTRDAVIYACPQCTLFQIENDAGGHHYEAYIAPVTAGDDMARHRREALEYLVAASGGRERLLDIGCGPGPMMELAKDKFRHVVGVDPSSSAATLARESGFTVIHDYFHAGLFEENYFDAFCSAQVFEHLEDPVSLLKDAYAVLKPGGVGLIEVPNGQIVMDNARFYSIFSEHLNYYTPFSAAVLAQLAGFQILCVRLVKEEEYLELFLRKSALRQETISGQWTRQLEAVRQKMEGYSNIVAWGAGIKAVAFLSALNKTVDFKAIVDSDPMKAGRYIAGISAPIQAPSREILDNADALVILAITYEDEIIKTLREQFDYKGEVVSLKDL